ncbi:MAG: hypothetical protein H6Q15_1411 [Bacteroidetes bacterium]|nr:hypothetical protein [Bacteroidota bacterium]
MKSYKVLSVVFLFFLIGISTKAQVFYAINYDNDTIRYMITSNTPPYTVEVTNPNNVPLKKGPMATPYSYYSGTLVIPPYVTHDSIQYSVTSIGENAFSPSFLLRGVRLPNTIKTIRKNAFQESGVRSLYIPDSVTYIEGSIGSHLTKIIMPNSTFTINPENFDYFFENYYNQEKYIYFTSNNPLIIENKPYDTMYANSRSHLVFPCDSSSEYLISPYWNAFPNKTEADVNYIYKRQCDGTYNENGFDVNMTGFYERVINRNNGCDSIVFLDFSMNDIPRNLRIHKTFNIYYDVYALSWNGSSPYYEIYIDDIYHSTTRFNTEILGPTDTNIHRFKVRGISGDCISNFSEELCQSVSLEKIKKEDIDINIYPNPCNGFTKLSFEGLNSNANVCIIDMFGKEISRYNINPFQDELKINLQGYTKGIYCIMLIDERGKSISTKLIIQ